MDKIREEVVKFNGEDVRFRFDEFNNTEVLLQDVARYCGWEKSEIKKNKEYKSIRWKIVKDFLGKIGFDHLMSKTNKELKSIYVEQRCMYMLIGKADNDNSREFMKWVAEIISNIRKNGLHVSSDKEMEKWFGIRKDSKVNRRNETDQIKLFIEYAKSQGSKSADKYYIHFSNMANKYAGINPKSRDIASQQELIDVIAAENIIRRYIKKELEKGIEYKNIYKNVKKKIDDLI